MSTAVIATTAAVCSAFASAIATGAMIVNMRRQRLARNAFMDAVESGNFSQHAALNADI